MWNDTFEIAYRECFRINWNCKKSTHCFYLSDWVSECWWVRVFSGILYLLGLNFATATKFWCAGNRTDNIKTFPETNSKSRRSSPMQYNIVIHLFDVSTIVLLIYGRLAIKSTPLGKTIASDQPSASNGWACEPNNIMYQYQYFPFLSLRFGLLRFIQLRNFLICWPIIVAGEIENFVPFFSPSVHAYTRSTAVLCVALALAPHTFVNCFRYYYGHVAICFC